MMKFLKDTETFTARSGFSKLALSGVSASAWNLELPDATLARIEVGQIDRLLTARLLDVDELTETGAIITT
jgi:hypothetical protein